MFTRDGGAILAASANFVQRWELYSDRKQKYQLPEGNAIKCMTVTNSDLLTGDNKGTIAIFDANKPERPLTKYTLRLGL